eukprot:1151860-Pelagomonas_calceolata.AAC.1
MVYIYISYEGSYRNQSPIAHATVVSKAQEVHGGQANHLINEMRLKCTGSPREPKFESWSA